jgi:3-oxoadipate enol-lactonase/4-carboxymuconolactone decarboxylase
MDGNVNTPAGRLHYRVDGPDDGPPVLLVNALGSTLDLWAAQVDAWAHTFRVIRYDTRGHGASSVPAGDYTIDDLGSDAVCVLDAVGVESAHVCGISLGGLTAMWMGVHVPMRVRSLVLANTAGRVGTRERWLERAAKVRVHGMTAVADLTIGNWFTPGFRDREPATVARFHQAAASTSPDGYIGCCGALRDADLRRDIRRIRVSTLVVAGDHDPSTSVADAEAIAAAIHGSTLITLSGAHLTNVECAGSFSRHAGMAFQGAEIQRDDHGHRASGDAMRRRILGDAHVDRARQGATLLTAEFQNFITRYVWGEVWTRPGLDERTRRVLVIGTMIALGRWEEFTLHVRAAVVEGGFTADDIKEIVLQQAVYCGVPAANHALKVAGEVLSALG